MTENRKTWIRFALLAAAVLAVHLWLLVGWKNIVAPVLQRAAPWTARTVALPVEPAPGATQPVAMSTPPPAPAPAKTAERNKVTPPPDAAKKQPAPRAPSVPAKPREPERPAVAATPRDETAPASPAATHAAGAAPARSALFAVPPSARYHYAVTAQKNGLVLRGEADLQWRNENGSYDAVLHMGAPLPFVKPRTQHSTGAITAQGLAPTKFTDKVRSEEAAHFDREQGKVIFSTNKPEALLAPGAQDRLSIVLQLSAMLAGDPKKFPAGAEITIQTASTKEAEPWTFTVAGREMLDLPGGRVAAVRLTRNPRKEYDTKVELWLAPGQAYAPVRLRLTQPNGDWVDQQWSSTDRG